MTPAEMESELSSIRTRLFQLEDREHKRAEAWKSILTIIQWSVIGLGLLALGILVFNAVTDRRGIEMVITLLLINIPLMFVGQALRIGISSIGAKD